MKTTRVYEVAEAVIKIKGNCKITKLLCQEFALCEVEDIQQEADLVINIFDEESDDFKPIYYTLSGNISFNKTDYLKRESGYYYIVKDLFVANRTTILNIYYSRKQSFRDILINVAATIFGKRGYVNKSKKIGYNVMSYNLFWYVFPMILAKKNKVFVHAASLEMDGKGLTIIGTSGCGKTSTAFRLLEEDYTKYLSEDFSIVSHDGKIFFNPKKMSIHRSDVQYGAKDLVIYAESKMKFTEKIFWQLHKFLKINTMNKVAPDRVLGIERLSEKEVVMDKAYFFVRHNSKDIIIKQITTVELVERVFNASFRELGTLYEIITNIKAVGHRDIDIPEFFEILNRAKELYMEAFENAEKYIVYIPLKCTPYKILEEIGLT